MVNTENFTRINNDINGNPRYVIHYSECVSDKDFLELHGVTPSEQKELNAHMRKTEYAYGVAVVKMNKLGGRKYNTKNYGGGIVFQSYNLQSLCDRINEMI